MSADKQEWFVAERSRALAMIALTRRDDLIITKPGQGIGLEFIVSILKDKGEQSLRQFGVSLQGTKTALTETHLDKILRPIMGAFVRKGLFPYPVCHFHFSMDEDQGYFTWVAEPAVTDKGPRLLMHNVPHCRKLDKAALDEIVSQVDRWYDAFSAR